MLFKLVAHYFSFYRHHKLFSMIIVLYVIFSTLSAIEHHSYGGWDMILVFFYLAVLMFTLGSVEIILLSSEHYSGFENCCCAISRVLSCYGISATIIFMCNLYEYHVYY